MKKKINQIKQKVASKLLNRKGSFFTEHALIIVITVVLGVILFLALLAAFNVIIIPGLTDRLNNIFSNA